MAFHDAAVAKESSLGEMRTTGPVKLISSRASSSARIKYHVFYAVSLYYDGNVRSWSVLFAKAGRI